MKIEKQSEKNPNKVGRPQEYENKEVYRSAKRVRDQSYQKEYWMIKRENQREDDWMVILENKLEARYRLTRLLISTGYMESNIEVLVNTLKQKDDVLNKEIFVTVSGLDVVRWVVKDEIDTNMDGLNSDEDEVSVKDEVPIREGKIS